MCVSCEKRTAMVLGKVISFGGDNSSRKVKFLEAKEGYLRITLKYKRIREKTYLLVQGIPLPEQEKDNTFVSEGRRRFYIYMKEKTMCKTTLLFK